MISDALIDGRFLGSAHGPAPDLALVEIADPLVDLPPLPLARLDRDGAEEAVVDCHAYGFPWFSKVRSPTTIREVVDAIGAIPVLSKLVFGFASVHVRDAPRKLPPVDRRLTDSPWSGISGGPVISGGKLLGVVIEHAAREGESTITMAPISLLDPNPDYPMWGPGVGDPGAWWNRLGVTGITDLTVLPERSRHAGPEEVELGPDVVEKYLPAFDSAGIVPPAHWTASALGQIVVNESSPRLMHLVQPLRHAAVAKAILIEMGINQLGLAQLQVIYRREVGAWPTARTADVMLVEAAEVESSERRRRAAGVLGALARFVTGVAVARFVPPAADPRLAAWIGSLGYQVADAQSRYQDQLNARAWLLIDLGGEPGNGTAGASAPAALPWPTRITWTHTTRKGTDTTQVTGEKNVVPTKEGLAAGLKAIFAALPPVHLLLVDLAVPAGLLGAGIEHWPLFPPDAPSESLSDRHYPRLRWSQRLHDLYLRGRCVERAAQSSWEVMPRSLTEAVLADEPRLNRWIQNDTTHAWLIGRRPAAARADPLRTLLKAGYGFLVWLPGPAEQDRRRAITRAVSRIPAAARRVVIPDELVRCPGQRMVIWDDPRGRGYEFDLPSSTAADHISTLLT
jgi:hypothetical protein